MTGCRAAWVAITLALICSNWALRSGCREPSSALRLACRLNPRVGNSRRTLLALTLWPISCKAAASLSWLFETHNSGRMGSPRVTGSTMRFRSSMSVGSVLDKYRRPPPLRRSRPSGGGSASRSFNPRPMVERASPVICETSSRPPRPAARTSMAANTRRPRSSSFEPTVTQRSRIAWQSIMSTRIGPFTHRGNPAALSHITAWRQRANRFSLCGGCPKRAQPAGLCNRSRRGQALAGRRVLCVAALCMGRVAHPLDYHRLAVLRHPGRASDRALAGEQEPISQCARRRLSLALSWHAGTVPDHLRVQRAAAVRHHALQLLERRGGARHERGCLYGRDRPFRPAGGRPRPADSGTRARYEGMAGDALGRSAAGAAHHHSADRKPVHRHA